MGASLGPGVGDRVGIAVGVRVQRGSMLIDTLDGTASALTTRSRWLYYFPLGENGGGGGG